MKTNKKSGFTLAEGTSYRNLLQTKANGFTLAEVLITLGIIGVVAAMTIPTLIANTNSTKFKSQFKKTMSTATQAVRMAEAQYDINFATLDQDCGGATDDPNVKASICALFNGTLAGATYYDNLRNQKIPGSNTAYRPNGGPWLTSGTWAGYQLADGSIIGIRKNTKGCTVANGAVTSSEGYCMGFIDVNGFAGPNSEVACRDGSTISNAGTPLTNTESQNCDVRKIRDDIFPIHFYDGTVQADTVGVAVLSAGK